MTRIEGLYVRFGDRLDPRVNARVHELGRRLVGSAVDGVTDVYPGNVNVYVEFDAGIICRDWIETWIRAHLVDLKSGPDTAGRHVSVPVRYDGEDLASLAAQFGCSEAEVVAAHSQELHRVYAVGFVPGQPMLGPVDSGGSSRHRFHLARRASPRTRVPAGSVAIAVGQTTIYPLVTPGGWHLIGTALEPMYDPHRQDPFFLAPGDIVRFESTQSTQQLPVIAPLEILPESPRRPALQVDSAGFVDLVLDQGRRMASRFGMAQSGPMDARSARIANAVVGNPASAPLIEMTVKGPTLTALTDVIVSCVGHGLSMVVDGLPRPSNKGMLVRSGESISFTPQPGGARAYLAVAGGIEMESFLGSACTDLNGLVGRALQPGDVLGTPSRTDLWAGLSMGFEQLRDRTKVRLLAGPQTTTEALDALTSGAFTVSSLDRMGVRFEGPKVPPGEDLISEATPLGSVQVTTGGDPIVLLNDRGRIGGYSKPAVIDPRDLPLMGQLLPGQTVRFLPPHSTSSDHWFMEA